MNRSRIAGSLVSLCLATACGAPAESHGELSQDELSVDEVSSEVEAVATAEQELISRAVVSETPAVIYADPYGDGSANPAERLRAIAAAAFNSRQSCVGLKVGGLPPNRVFGAHVHKLSCNDNKAGTHYQNVPSPTTPTDPAYANASNETWLDFKTDSRGYAIVITTSNFLIRRNEANAIVIHTNATASGGVAGAKLGCIDLDF